MDIFRKSESDFDDAYFCEIGFVDFQLCYLTHSTKKLQGNHQPVRKQAVFDDNGTDTICICPIILHK